MTFFVKGRKPSHKVRFPHRSVETTGTAESSAEAWTLQDRTKTPPQNSRRPERLRPTGGKGARPTGIPGSKDSNFAFKMAATTSPFTIPELFTTLPAIRGGLQTETSIDQDDVVQSILPFMSGEENGEQCNPYGVPKLDRARHFKFLHTPLEKLPAPYAAADAARPWFYYWCFNAMSTLGYDVSSFRPRLLSSVRNMQNSTGGYAGGHGHMSHIATTYAVTLALAVVGGEEAFEVIDRTAMWEWLGALKQPDGGFQVSVGGEEDIRGAYCAMTVICLLDLPLELPADSPARAQGCDTFLSGLGEWVSRCQTYEGGISACPDTEAHGAYAFCALACLAILGDPQVTITKYLNVPLLMSWLSARQNAPEGGFSGRTNKLVDGCYAHWVGACWPLLQPYLDERYRNIKTEGTDMMDLDTPSADGLFSREALIRYILCACQDEKRGGLRDKPGKQPDAYHTNYVLAGLSSAQHKWNFDQLAFSQSQINLGSPFYWTSEKHRENQIFDEDDRVNAVHPVFVVPKDKAEAMRTYFQGRPL